MSISSAISRAFVKKSNGGWEKYPRMYWAIDLHGVILDSTYKTDFDEQIIDPACARVLQKLSQKNNACLIIFTASNEEYINNVLQWLSKLDIHFDFVNGNPEVTGNEWCNTSEKFYCEWKPIGL